MLPRAVHPVSGGVRIRDIRDYNRAYVGTRDLVAGVRLGQEATRGQDHRI